MERVRHDCRVELRQAGFRATPGRVALMRTLEQEHVPRTVAELHEKLPSLNYVTLYRALEALVVAGLVRRGTDHGVARFSYAPGRTHHHHFVCTTCDFTPGCGRCGA